MLASVPQSEEGKRTLDPRRILKFTGGQSSSSFVCGVVVCRNMSPFRFSAVFKEFVNAVGYEYFVLFLAFVVYPIQNARTVAPVYCLIYL